MTRESPRLYGELAPWWHLMSAPEDYAEEAALYRGVLESAGSPRTLLELGSGGGNNASHLKRHYELTLVERSPGMLAASRALNPECEHVEGDMRSVRLGRTFDAVFVHDAVMYLTSEADLARAIETASVHCRPGGLALIAPDFFRESFRPATEKGGHDRDGRGLRYLAWSWDPDRSDTTFVTHYAFLVREGNEVRLVHDEHLEGLFARETWLALCRSAGLEPEILRLRHSEVDRELEVILCRKGLE